MLPAERYQKLEQHLSEENPVLVEVLGLYKQLDKIGYRTGILDKTETFTDQISWWPLISILGTFSAGKSSFINHYLGQKVQNTGNQAVDDKFTVICYGKNKEVTTLPGLALDADPRFPFYEISKEIEKVDSGEGTKVDNYLQLKTVNAEPVKGKILIDSPGFDADDQRSATLRITDHIVELSDLVLVFFDARHPEPGAMRDTLTHLVENVMHRNDSAKILFILNQIDTAAKEDNPEEVISAWQRAISQQGLVSGNFYTIYNEEAALTIEDPQLAERFKRKKDTDYAEIISRMNKVSVERTYRITDSVAKMAESLVNETLPKIQQAITRWRKKTLLWDGFIFTAIFVFLGWLIFQSGWINEPLTQWPILGWALQSVTNGMITLVSFLVIMFALHFWVRNKVCQQEVKRWQQEDPKVAKALAFNNRFWRGMFPKKPRGWGSRAFKMVNKISSDSKRLIQKLNDQFADPSGHQAKQIDQVQKGEEVETSKS